MILVLVVFIIAVLAGTVGVASGATGGNSSIQLVPEWEGEDLISASHAAEKLRQKPLFEQKPHLLTQAELHFYRALKEAVGNDYQIMCQVNLNRLIGLQLASRFSVKRIGLKYLDYVLCDPETLCIVATIELEDLSREGKGRMRRDEFLNHAMEEAGVALIRFPVQAVYSPEQIAQKIVPLKQRSAA